MRKLISVIKERFYFTISFSKKKEQSIEQNSQVLATLYLNVMASKNRIL